MLRICLLKNFNHGYDFNIAPPDVSVPEGWAVIPESMDTPNFPFGDIEVEEIDGVMTVTKWIPGELPAPIQPTPSELREQAYNNDRIIEWEDSMITVTEASQKWQYYASEGSNKANELQSLIAAAKEKIREQYPD